MQAALHKQVASERTRAEKEMSFVEVCMAEETLFVALGLLYSARLADSFDVYIRLAIEQHCRISASLPDELHGPWKRLQPASWRQDETSFICSRQC